MAVEERLQVYSYGDGDVHIEGDWVEEEGRWIEVGKVSVEIINSNVVITVTREDEAKFGPVSVVVV